jgi:hypothetical protein
MIPSDIAIVRRTKGDTGAMAVPSGCCGCRTALLVAQNSKLAKRVRACPLQGNTIRLETVADLEEIGAL